MPVSRWHEQIRDPTLADGIFDRFVHNPDRNARGVEVSEVFHTSKPCGAGVPEQFISYARSLVGQAIEFYSCFISYSSKDQKFAERLHADLRAKNLRVWFAPKKVL